MRKAAYFVVMVIILLSCLATGCGSKAQPQLLSASGTTCTVRNSGPTGEVKVTCYQSPSRSRLMPGKNLVYKQWVIFPLAEGEEITLEFGVIEDASQVGRGRYYVSGPLPEDAHGGSKKERFTVEQIMGGGESIKIVKDKGPILKETESPYFYSTGCGWYYCFGFRVE